VATTGCGVQKSFTSVNVPITQNGNSFTTSVGELDPVLATSLTVLVSRPNGYIAAYQLIKVNGRCRIALSNFRCCYLRNPPLFNLIPACFVVLNALNKLKGRTRSLFFVIYLTKSFLQVQSLIFFVGDYF
jgi:hypothetical protein